MKPPRPARVAAPPARNPRKPLTPEQCDLIRRAIRGGATRDEAAALAGIARRTLDTRLNDQLVDLRVGQGRQSPNRRRDERGYLLSDEPDPTPELIALRAAEVRRSWPPERYLGHVEAVPCGYPPLQREGPEASTNVHTRQQEQSPCRPSPPPKPLPRSSENWSPRSRT